MNCLGAERLISEGENDLALDVLKDLKESHGILCIGVENNGGKNFMANPDKDHLLEENDNLIVIASDRPQIN